MVISLRRYCVGCRADEISSSEAEEVSSGEEPEGGKLQIIM